MIYFFDTVEEKTELDCEVREEPPYRIPDRSPPLFFLFFFIDFASEIYIVDYKNIVRNVGMDAIVALILYVWCDILLLSIRHFVNRSHSSVL